MPVFVNATEITDDQVFAEMQYHPASSVEEAQEKAATALAIRALLLQEAARLGIATPDQDVAEETREDFLISRLLEQEVEMAEPDALSCQRCYEQHPEIFCDTQGNPVRFEHVQTTIAAYLKELSWQVAVKQYLDKLAGQAQIVGLSPTAYHGTKA